MFETKEVGIDAEELRQLRLDAWCWAESQRLLKERKASNGICPYCGGPTSTPRPCDTRPETPRGQVVTIGINFTGDNQ
jgi:hypothetical protein